MLVSMVCMLSVSDMLGMKSNPQHINPREAMKKIEENPKAWEAFNAIFKGHEDLIKKNCCCCGGINIEKTELPKDEGDKAEAIQYNILDYINYRFKIEEGTVKMNDLGGSIATCKKLDELIDDLYSAKEE